jgi:enoyl-CoA hydratase/carnithine racemase
MDVTEPTIVYDLKDSVACVRLNRPQKLNAFTFEMIDRLHGRPPRFARWRGEPP